MLADRSRCSRRWMPALPPAKPLATCSPAAASPRTGYEGNQHHCLRQSIADTAADRIWAAWQGQHGLPAPPRITAVGKVRFTSSRRSSSCSVTLTCTAEGSATRMSSQACMPQQGVRAGRPAGDMHTADPLQAVLTNRGSLLSCSRAARSLWACLSFLSNMSIALLPTAHTWGLQLMLHCCWLADPRVPRRYGSS